jgi:methylmalonyl-CoA mutase N-terminal domain/subunit
MTIHVGSISSGRDTNIESKISYNDNNVINKTLNDLDKVKGLTDNKQVLTAIDELKEAVKAKNDSKISSIIDTINLVAPTIGKVCTGIYNFFKSDGE